MAKIIDARLRDNVHLLGELLGNTIRAQHGDQFFDKIERIRKGAKAARRGSAEGAQQLAETLDSLDEHELLPMTRRSTSFSTWPTSPSSITRSVAVQPVSLRRSRRASSPICSNA